MFTIKHQVNGSLSGSPVDPPPVAVDSNALYGESNSESGTRTMRTIQDHVDLTPALTEQDQIYLTSVNLWNAGTTIYWGTPENQSRSLICPNNTCSDTQWRSAWIDQLFVRRFDVASGETATLKNMRMNYSQYYYLPERTIAVAGSIRAISVFPCWIPLAREGMDAPNFRTEAGDATRGQRLHNGKNNSPGGSTGWKSSGVVEFTELEFINKTNYDGSFFLGFQVSAIGHYAGSSRWIHPREANYNNLTIDLEYD